MLKPWAFYTLYYAYAILCLIVPALAAVPRRKAWLITAAALAAACAWGLNRTGSLIALAIITLSAAGVGRVMRAGTGAAALGATVLALPVCGIFLLGLLYALDLDTHENVCFAQDRLNSTSSCLACNQALDSVHGWRIVVLRPSPSLFVEDVIGTVTYFAGARPAGIDCTVGPNGTVGATAIDRHSAGIETYPMPAVRLPVE